MGYHTEFDGAFDLNKQLTAKMSKYLDMFANSRRMTRTTTEFFGIDGEFDVFEDDKTVVDINKCPSTQPGLWCQWIPTEDGMLIEWDGGEKFYEYTAWIVYLINKVLAPNGYVLNGEVRWRGEEFDDTGSIVIKDNVVFENGVEMGVGESLRPDVVLILDNLQDNMLTA